ncbi:hypothetical protein T02_8590 [Trichinella nativa]|uniref:Uncharacterized protein n=1 Tax=Trichinella nativa TaxID=6335 RepID=A0A0V1L3T7_9BILA|nr:hypothetical protein T02_8590 [Trichinella nativa]
MCGYVIELSLTSNSVPIKEEYFSRKSQNFMGYRLGFSENPRKICFPNLVSTQIVQWMWNKWAVNLSTAHLNE